MKKNNIIVILYNLISFVFQKNLKNGVYNILNENQYVTYHKKEIYLSFNFNKNSFLKIVKVSGFFNNSLYRIEQIESNNKMIYLQNAEISFSGSINNLDLWKIIKTNKETYIIQNINKCYIIIKGNKFFCQYIPENIASQFIFIKIYKEVNKHKDNNINNEILKNEPIDILIKYIDLRDKNLKRNGIHQIDKDYDNEELRYSLRSIFYNIPWIRKIFILMPNNKVRYFKDYNLIKDKIVYVHDKDFLGYDSSNFNAFLFRYWKMKKFGISNNFIIMDDDYFIGKKLNKNDFFYVEKGRVVPLIVTSNFIKLEPKSVEKNLEFYKKRVRQNKEEQGGDEWNLSTSLTFSFILKFFNISNDSSIYIPKFTHNAIPVNIRELKEVYYLAYNSEYKYSTLDCLYRISGYLQFQLLIMAYTFIKYGRKVSNIPSKFIQLNDSISANYRFSLFCINKGAGHFNYLNYYKARIVMEYLFPNPTPYEIIDYSILKISFNVTYSLDLYLKQYQHIIYQMMSKDDFYILREYIFFFFAMIYFKVRYKVNYYNNE